MDTWPAEARADFAASEQSRKHYIAQWIAYLMIVLVCASALRLYRCIWVLENLISIVTEEKKAKG